MPPFHHHVRGLCHGITPVFLPAGAVGSALALLHVALCVAQRSRRRPPEAPPASPTTPLSSPVPRSPFLASPTSPIATRVSTPPRRALRPPAPHHPPSSPHADAAARSTPPVISVPI